MHPDCPTRPVDWRWERARSLLEDAARPCKWDDAAVREARDYPAALRRRHRRGDERRLAERVPDVHEARVLHLGERHRRWEIEARLLAREPAVDIARKTVTTPSGVAAYERLFFDVTERLGSRGYVIHRAIWSTRCRAPDDGRPRLLSYSGGPHVVDAMVQGSRYRQARGTGRGSAFLTRFTGNQLLMKVCVGVLTMPVEGLRRACAVTWPMLASRRRSDGFTGGAEGGRPAAPGRGRCWSSSPTSGRRPGQPGLTAGPFPTRPGPPGMDAPPTCSGRSRPCTLKSPGVPDGAKGETRTASGRGSSERGLGEEPHQLLL